MSKKGKPTQVITITRSGNTVSANREDVYASGEVNGCVALARCHPNDTFDFYEGARIALARAFGKDPFPKTEEEETSGKTPQFRDGKWVKARFGNCGKRGDWIRIDAPWETEGLYKLGDILQIDVTDSDGLGCCVRFSKADRVKFIATSEYSIWVPEKAEKKKPEPITPSFCVGDYVKTGTQIVQINDIIRAHGFETACALCFVDAKRFRQDNLALAFTDMYNRAVRSLIPEGKEIPVNTFDFAGPLDTRPNAELDFSGLRDTMSNFDYRTASYKIAKYLMNHPADRKLLDKSDFLSSAGFNVIAREKPGILSLFNSKKGSSGAKATFGDVQYLNEIIRSRTFNPDRVFAVGGVRLQSFSDYVPRLVFDYVQIVSDLAAKKLPAHSYTKEELFVKQFGLTGIKINMSLIPRVAKDGIAPGLDSRGNYIWAKESFDFQTAMEIQSAEGYSRNCGTIAVGISDEHIRAMMADDRIRMIIPYHKSGLNPVVARMNNIGEFVDYTDYNNTRNSDGMKITDKKLLKEIPDFNQEMRRLGDPRAAAESYVRFCESKGYIPKFEQFAYQQVDGVFVEEDGRRVVDPNYYKLLEDFTVYDKGEYVGQEAVRTVYPGDDAAFGSMADLIRRGLDEDAVLEGRRDAEVADIVREVRETLGDVRASALRDGDSRDTMSTSRYSLREDLEYGTEQRESEEEFRRRGLREGYENLSIGKTVFAFRRVHGRGSVLPDARRRAVPEAEPGIPAGETARELTALGIPCDVISGPVFWNSGSVTRGRVIPEAATVAGSHVFIDENASLCGPGLWGTP